MAKLREFEINAIVDTIVKKLGEGVIEARKAKLEPIYQEMLKEFQELEKENILLRQQVEAYDQKQAQFFKKVREIEYLQADESHGYGYPHVRVGTIMFWNTVEKSTAVPQKVIDAVRTKVILSGIGKGDLNETIDSIVSEFKSQIQ